MTKLGTKFKIPQGAVRDEDNPERRETGKTFLKNLPFQIFPAVHGSVHADEFRQLLNETKIQNKSYEPSHCCSGYETL